VQIEASFDTLKSVFETARPQLQACAGVAEGRDAVFAPGDATLDIARVFVGALERLIGVAEAGGGQIVGLCAHAAASMANSA